MKNIYYILPIIIIIIFAVPELALTIGYFLLIHYFLVLLLACAVLVILSLFRKKIRPYAVCFLLLTGTLSSIFHLDEYILFFSRNETNVVFLAGILFILSLPPFTKNKWIQVAATALVFSIFLIVIMGVLTSRFGLATNYITIV